MGYLVSGLSPCPLTPQALPPAGEGGTGHAPLTPLLPLGEQEGSGKEGG